MSGRFFASLIKSVNVIRVISLIKSVNTPINVPEGTFIRNLARYLTSLINSVGVIRLISLIKLL